MSAVCHVCGGVFWVQIDFLIMELHFVESWCWQGLRSSHLVYIHVLMDLHFCLLDSRKKKKKGSHPLTSIIVRKPFLDGCFLILDSTLKMFSKESKMLQRSVSFSNMVSSFHQSYDTDPHSSLFYTHVMIFHFCQNTFIPMLQLQNLKLFLNSI
jgi:hypothetical protein